MKVIKDKEVCMRILVLHGPNLNMLGSREPEHYGRLTLEGLNEFLTENAKVDLTFFQSNHEGQLIDVLQAANREVDGVVINPGAFTHYSYAIADTVKAMNIPVIEVHLSNIYQREAFRHKSVIAPYCKGQISGLGKMSYLLGIQALVEIGIKA